MPVAIEARSVALSDAKDHLSALTAQANETGHPFIIMKNRKPWVEVRPLAARTRSPEGISIRPLRREVSIPDIEALFERYAGDFAPVEDGFAPAAGSEEV